MRRSTVFVSGLVVNYSSDRHKPLEADEIEAIRAATAACDAKWGPGDLWAIEDLTDDPKARVAYRSDFVWVIGARAVFEASVAVHVARAMAHVTVEFSVPVACVRGNDRVTVAKRIADAVSAVCRERWGPGEAEVLVGSLGQARFKPAKGRR